MVLPGFLASHYLPSLILWVVTCTLNSWNVYATGNAVVKGFRPRTRAAPSGHPRSPSKSAEATGVEPRCRSLLRWLESGHRQHDHELVGSSAGVASPKP